MRFEPPHLADRNDDRKSRAFADEQEALLTADAQDVAIPVAEQSRRFPVDRDCAASMNGLDVSWERSRSGWQETRNAT